jgi:CDP-diglyceride synthetase
VLSFYPRDVAVEAILLYAPCITMPGFFKHSNLNIVARLSWADTAASTFGRIYGHRTPNLPSKLPVLGLPLAARKSLAGAIGSFTTAVITTVVFWGFCTRGSGRGLPDPVWIWDQPRTGGWFGLSLLSVCAGFVTSITEILGESLCSAECSFRSLMSISWQISVHGMTTLLFR